jgi:tetraacyldisaccharide 4'-kinase
LLLFQRILRPISFLYEGVLRLRNHLYNKEFFGSTEFDIPTINVGNLAFGGTGKTPHIEYLINLLSTNFHVSILSRGYKRKTLGYVFADKNSSPFSIGDEPFQMHHKFPQINVAVCENRVLGIPNLLMDAPNTDLILLDDAYQHRALKPGLNILLTEQNKLYVDDYLVPSGYLREYPSAAKRADIIVVTKCDINLDDKTKAQITQRLAIKDHQSIYFSFIKYGELKPLFNTIAISKNTSVLAIAGIANPANFKKYLDSNFNSVLLKSFPDHHILSEKEIHEIINLYKNLPNGNSIIVCTEKDSQKLFHSPFAEELKNYPIYYLPIEISFFDSDKEAFNQKIIHYVNTNRSNN